MALALAGPTTLARSASVCRRTSFTLPNFRSRSRAVLSPMPGMSVRAVRKVPLLRLSLWKVMAKRWTSFCSCSKRWKRGSVGLRPTTCGGNP